MYLALFTPSTFPLMKSSMFPLSRSSLTSLRIWSCVDFHKGSIQPWPSICLSPSSVLGTFCLQVSMRKVSFADCSAAPSTYLSLRLEGLKLDWPGLAKYSGTRTSSMNLLKVIKIELGSSGMGRSGWQEARASQAGLMAGCANWSAQEVMRLRRSQNQNQN